MKNKQEVRKSIKKLFSERKKESLQEKEEIIVQEIFQLAQSSENIALYVASKNEIPTLHLIETLVQTGKNIFLPKTVSETEMKLVQIQSLDELQKGRFGI